MVKARKQKGSIWMNLFAGAFLIPGLLVIFWGFVPVLKYLSTSDWQRVDAYVVDVEQVISRGSDSTTYGVKGLFRYHFEDLEYQSKQLNFYGGTDNIGDYQIQFYRRLKNANSSNQAITAWVNPDAPENAVIDRNLRFGLVAFKFIFGLVFAAVGVAVLFFSRHMVKRIAENANLAALYPQEPWRWRKEWAGDTVKTNAGMHYKMLVVFAVVWNLISIPVAAVVNFGDEAHALGIKLMILIFPLIGLYLIHLAFRAYLNWRRHGEANLRMDPAPFSIGSHNTGEVRIPGIRLGDDFILTLSCIKKTRRRSGKQTRTHSEIQWQHDRRVKAGPGSDGIGKLEYAFSIPENLPESKELTNKQSIEWQLSVKGAGETKLELAFEVPGFMTSRSNQSDNRSNGAVPEWNQDTLKSAASFFPSTTGDWTHLGVSQRKERGGTHYYFPPARNLKIALGFTIFGLIFLGAGIGLFMADAGLFFAIIFGGIGLLFALVGLHALLFRSELRIAEGILYVRSGVLRMSDQAECAGTNIHEFDISSKIQSGNTRVYRLSVVLTNGEKILLGKNLLVKSDVESLANQIYSDLDLPSVPEKTG